MTTTPFDDDAETMPTETIPPTDSPPYTQRVFRYDTHTIPDPGIHLSVEDVRKALITYFPDLVQATTSTQVEGDSLVVTFTKQTTRKGAAEFSPPSDVADLAERLCTLSPLPDALTALSLPEHLTLAEIAARRADIHAALHTYATQLRDHERMYRRCLTLTPTPLTMRLPLGF